MIFSHASNNHKIITNVRDAKNGSPVHQSGTWALQLSGGERDILGVSRPGRGNACPSMPISPTGRICPRTWRSGKMFGLFWVTCLGDRHRDVVAAKSWFMSTFGMRRGAAQQRACAVVRLVRAVAGWASRSRPARSHTRLGTGRSTSALRRALRQPRIRTARLVWPAAWTGVALALGWAGISGAAVRTRQGESNGLWSVSGNWQENATPVNGATNSFFPRPADTRSPMI